MRLIDMDNLDFSKQKLNKSQLKAVLDFLDSQEIAYDYDGVMKLLEKRKVENTRCAKLKGNSQTKTVSLVCRVDEDSIALDIVKNGGNPSGLLKYNL